MSSELVERLEVAAQWDSSPSQLIHEAIARIEALEAEVARLREALEPFAKAADNFDEFKINNDVEWFAYSGIQRATGSVGAITVADLRAARRALEGGNADG
jgi:predicted transcriptional regulator